MNEKTTGVALTEDEQGVLIAYAAVRHVKYSELADMVQAIIAAREEQRS